MMEQILYNEMTYWLLATSIIFTFVGRYFAQKEDVTDIVAATIDSLIEEGYLKTKTGDNGDIEVLKYDEETN